MALSNIRNPFGRAPEPQAVGHPRRLAKRALHLGAARHLLGEGGEAARAIPVVGPR